MTTEPEASDIASFQLALLQRLVAELLEHNRFYGPRLRAAGFGDGVDSLEHFTSSLGFTSKAELVADQQQHPPYGQILTYPQEHYVRLHQTSGTSGQPLRWLDTASGWQWMLDNWRRVFAACDVGPVDRIFFPFSFGPFLGFWTAFEAASQLGCLTLAGGGMSSAARLRLMLDNQATVVCCTPTYAIRLAEVASEEGVDLAAGTVSKVIVAGEPGGSLKAVRQRIHDLWHGAEVLDHHGMTEIGPVSYPNRQVPRLLHIIERSYLAEIVDRDTLQPVTPGDIGELVLTTLGRAGSPLLRYRTGDLVRQSSRSAEELGSTDLALEGGILARADDMVVVRGVNLYPSAVDRVVREFAQVAEYRVDLAEQRGMVEVEVRIEPAADCMDPSQLAGDVGRALRTSFQLRIPVTLADVGELPRFELKAKRWRRTVAHG